MAPDEPTTGSPRTGDTTVENTSTGTGAPPQPTERQRPAAGPPAPEPATSPVAPDDSDEQPAEDLSGRPPLADVAQQRADTVIERRLPAEKE